MNRCLSGLVGLATGGWFAWTAVPTVPSPDAAAPNVAVEPVDGDDGTPADTVAEAAGTPKNPYYSIVARNPFGLKPEPPPPAPPPEQPVVSTTALKLTGITTLLGGKRAMFVVEEPGKTNVVSDLVREGDWDTYITNLQVLRIDERVGAVQVVYGGKELALNFKDNGIKPPTSPVPAPGVAVPGAPGRPGVAPGRPATAVGAVGAPPTTLPQVPTPTVIGAPGGSGLRQVPSRPSRLATPTAGVQPEMPPAMTPEQQALSMKAQEIIARQQGISLPPTPPIPGVDFPPGPGAQNIPMPPGIPGVPHE